MDGNFGEECNLMIEKPLLKIIQSPNDTKKLPNSKNLDDSAIFGKRLAAKLRQLTDVARQKIMYDIQGMFLRRSQKLLTPFVAEESEVEAEVTLKGDVFVDVDIKPDPFDDKMLMPWPTSTGHHIPSPEDVKMEERVEVEPEDVEYRQTPSTGHHTTSPEYVKMEEECEVKVEPDDVEYRQTSSAVHHELSPTYPEVKLERSDAEYQQFFSIMEENTGDSQDERNRKRKIDDTIDDKNKRREEKLRKARERSKRYREKKRNEGAALVIGDLSDADIEKKREERLRYDREKSKRYRERKKKERPARISGDSTILNMKKERQRQNSKRYRDKKRTLNLQTQNTSNRKNVPQQIHSSQIASPSKSDAPNVIIFRGIKPNEHEVGKLKLEFEEDEVYSDAVTERIVIETDPLSLETTSAFHRELSPTYPEVKLERSDAEYQQTTSTVHHELSPTYPEVKLERSNAEYQQTTSAVHHELSSTYPEVKLERSDAEYQQFQSMMDKNVDDSHEDRKGQINDSSDDDKMEKINKKNREKCKRYREKKNNEVAALPISGSSDPEEKRREEERKQKNTEKTKQYREKIETGDLSMDTADSSSDSYTISKQARRKQKNAEKCKRYRERKRKSNLQTQNISDRKNVPQQIHNSQIACLSTRDLPNVPPVIHTSQIAIPSTTYVPYVPPVLHSSTIAGPSSRDVPYIPLTHSNNNSPIHSIEDRVIKSPPLSPIDLPPPNIEECMQYCTHVKFENDFDENEFEHACDICGKLCFKKDLKYLPNNDTTANIEFIRTLLSNIDIQEIKVCPTCVTVIEKQPTMIMSSTRPPRTYSRALHNKNKINYVII